MSLNKVILIGNVGKDPEIKKSGENNEVVLINLATSESWKDKVSGEKKEKTEWHRVVIYASGLVNIAKTYIKQGDKIYVEGSLQTTKYTDKEGVERTITQVVLKGFDSKIEILSEKNKNNMTDNKNNEEKQLSKEVSDSIPF